MSSEKIQGLVTLAIIAPLFMYVVWKIAMAKYRADMQAEEQYRERKAKEEELLDLQLKEARRKA